MEIGPHVNAGGQFVQVLQVLGHFFQVMVQESVNMHSAETTRRSI